MDAYPDVVVYCEDASFEDNRPETLLEPIVLVEVLSPTTAKYDRTAKLQAYMRIPTLTDYVIVWQDMVRIEHHFRSGDDRWELQQYLRRTDAVRLESLRIEVPLEEIYRRLDLPNGVLDLPGN